MTVLAGTVNSGVSPRQKNIISSPVVGVLLFVFIEIMFFSALISSYYVIRRGKEVWDIPAAVRLPALAAGFNTGVLLLSGLFLLLAGRAFEGRKGIADARSHLLRSLVLAGFFLAFQIYLGLGLVNAGLTMNTSIFGGCYFLMVGAHSLQVLVGILAMTKIYLTTDKAPDQSVQNVQSVFRGLQIFWLFSVGVWPILYAQIYF